MSEQPRRRRTSPWIVWSAFVFVLIVLYLGSYGPVVWLTTHDRISPETHERIYATVYFPINRTADNTSFFGDNPVGRAYADYVLWWAE